LTASTIPTIIPTTIAKRKAIPAPIYSKPSKSPLWIIIETTHPPTQPANEKGKPYNIDLPTILKNAPVAAPALSERVLLLGSVLD
jgi:hypothetical protein